MNSLTSFSRETRRCQAARPGRRWCSERNSIRYTPLVTTPTFAGVFWANFLGPGHLADFDVAKIQSIEAYRTKWHGKTGLAVVSAPTLDDALTPDGEKELLRLTAEFRAAKVD
jgi:hypothetical protein